MLLTGISPLVEKLDQLTLRTTLGSYAMKEGKAYPQGTISTGELSGNMIPEWRESFQRGTYQEQLQPTGRYQGLSPALPSATASTTRCFSVACGGREEGG